jgi:acetate kinase
MQVPPSLLSINRGSSSLKFAIYAPHAAAIEVSVRGRIDRIGTAQAALAVTDFSHVPPQKLSLGVPPGQDADNFLIDWIDQHFGFDRIAAVGHRIVHGGPRFHRPTKVTPQLIDQLDQLSIFDPQHMPAEISLLRTLSSRFPALPQVACFDTGFHHDMPRVAQILPIPRHFDDQGVRRYGFHGLSYQYLLEELRREVGTEKADGRVILAHLGAGASLAAVYQGRGIDTTMAFTPTAGLPMATRSGDLDPGLVLYLSQTQNLTAQGFHDLVNHDSGLLGMSGTSGDLRDLLAAEATDPRAAEAIAAFCYATKKWLGAFAAALGGLDALVFAGGIGENLPVIRQRICDGLEFLGVRLDQAANLQNARDIAAPTSGVSVRVIPTDEELMIARATRTTLGERSSDTPASA